MKPIRSAFASLAVAVSAAAASPTLEPIASLDVPSYLGTWYQVALYPNPFQSGCVSDTTATYRDLGDGNIELVNRCRNARGSFDEAKGQARPTGILDAAKTLRPARLEVSFLPPWLRWAQAVGHWGWGAYWVIQLAPDYRFAVISEGTRQYLWVLSRTPALLPADETSIRAELARQGFDLSRLQAHPQSAALRSP